MDQGNWAGDHSTIKVIVNKAEVKAIALQGTVFSDYASDTTGTITVPYKAGAYDVTWTATTTSTEDKFAAAAFKPLAPGYWTITSYTDVCQDFGHEKS